ncbi:MAG: hypothetical protein AAF579_09945 [Cyanobacteria bacterium P01_C01_bin.118]
MDVLNSQPIRSQPIRWSNQPGPIAWDTVPGFIQKVLITEGCTLLKHCRERPLLPHIRFQYVPLAYQGELYYLQRWSHHEWGVSPSQLIFPAEGACSMGVLSNGSLLSQLVKKAVVRFYGDFPGNSPFQASIKRYSSGNMLSLAG